MAKKIALFMVSIIVLSFIVFYMSRLAPGNPLVAYYGDRAEKMTLEEKTRTLQRLGLDKPITVQYGIWVKEAVQGNFGVSYKYKESVLHVVGERIPNTLWLGGISFVLTFALALFVGIFCAIRENSWLDRVLTQLGIIASCVPTFWLALLLILLFSVTLSILPSSGAYAIGQQHSIANRLTHLVLPVSAMVLTHVWYYAVMVRNRLIEEFRQNYVLLLRAKGLSLPVILWRHCLKNILPTFFNIMAISLSHIIAGTYIVEMVFSYPGIGTLAFESAKYHDYNLLMLISLLTGVIVILCNMLSRALSEKIDPRMKATGGRLL